MNAAASNAFNSVALIGKYQSPDVAAAVLRLAKFLRERDCTVWIEQGTASSTGLSAAYPVSTYDEIGAGVVGRGDVALRAQLREDVVRPSMAREDFLANAPQQLGGHVKVPVVLSVPDEDEG